MYNNLMFNVGVEFYCMQMVECQRHLVLFVPNGIDLGDIPTVVP